MDLFTSIENRHSYRGPFEDLAVPKEDLRRIVEAGLLAPSGCNEQTTSFVIVDAPEIVGQIRTMHRSNIAMQQAQAYIACIIDVQPKGVYEGYNFQVEDCAAAVENMLLAITTLGYASVWVDGWLRLNDNSTRIQQLLGIPATKVVRVILPIGVPAAPVVPAREKRSFDERAWFNRYQS